MTPAFLCEAIPEDGPVPQLSVKPLNSDRKVFVAYSDKLPRAWHAALNQGDGEKKTKSSCSRTLFSGQKCKDSSSHIISWQSDLQRHLHDLQHIMSIAYIIQRILNTTVSTNLEAGTREWKAPYFQFLHAL